MHYWLKSALLNKNLCPPNKVLICWSHLSQMHLLYVVPIQDWVTWPRIHCKATCKATWKADLTTLGSHCQYLSEKVIHKGFLWRKANFLWNNLSQSWVWSISCYAGHKKICCIEHTPKLGERWNKYLLPVRFYLIMIFILAEPNSCMQPWKML